MSAFETEWVLLPSDASTVQGLIRPCMVQSNGDELVGKPAQALANALHNWSRGCGITDRDIRTLIRYLSGDRALVKFVSFLPVFIDEKNMIKRAQALKSVADAAHECAMLNAAIWSH